MLYEEQQRATALWTTVVHVTTAVTGCPICRTPIIRKPNAREHARKIAPRADEVCAQSATTPANVTFMATLCFVLGPTTHDTGSALPAWRCRRMVHAGQRYARLVHAVPVRHGLTPAEVDDVGQVFLALAQNLHDIDDRNACPVGW